VSRIEPTWISTFRLSAAVMFVAPLLLWSAGCNGGTSDRGKCADGGVRPNSSPAMRRERQGVLKNAVGGRRDVPWTITEALDESKRDLLDHCRAMREELLNRCDRTCRTSTDCMTTSGCIPVSIRDRAEALAFEKRWLMAGCPTKADCVETPIVCDRGKCEF
jgi:hypothetical protein